LAQQRLPWVNPESINPERVESKPHHAHSQIMAQSLANILVHTIFSTKDRHPFLHDRKLREELHRYLGGILTNLSCPPIIVGGVEDHVHLLSGLSRTCEPAAMVNDL
jgi:REP element-mobilizing transposase RayT